MRQHFWLGLLAVMLLAGCSRASADGSGVGVDIRVTPTPPALGPATVQVSLADEAKQPITGARVQLEGDMTHAGMAPVSAPATETAPGIYAAQLQFTMSGDWVLIVRADLPDGRTIERQQPIGTIR